MKQVLREMALLIRLIIAFALSVIVTVLFIIPSLFGVFSKTIRYWNQIAWEQSINYIWGEEWLGDI